jgi:flagellar motor switch protein FliG
MPRQTSNLRKAAVLVAALDRENAESILRQLPGDQAALVRRAAAELEDVAAAEQEAVIAEFFRVDPSAPRKRETRHPEPPRPNDSQMAGIELDGSLAERFARPRRAAAPAFQCLEDADCEKLAPLLEREHPQTIAVVISRLPHGKAARLLMGFSAPLQADVLQRLTALDQMDPESLREIERHLETWLSRETRHREVRKAGLSAVAQILQAAGPQGRETLVSNLRRRDGLLADHLASREPAGRTTPAPPPVEQPASAAPRVAPPTRPAIRFEQLTELADDALAAVLRVAEPELIVLALAGVETRVLTQFLRLLAPHEAAALRRDLEQLGPTRLSDVQAAQDELALVAGRIINAENEVIV